MPGYSMYSSTSRCILVISISLSLSHSYRILYWNLSSIISLSGIYIIWIKNLRYLEEST